MKIIQITVDPKGQATVETRGFVGPECRDASRFVERALGTATAETLTAAYHQAPVTEPRLEQSS